MTKYNPKFDVHCLTNNKHTITPASIYACSLTKMYCAKMAEHNGLTGYKGSIQIAKVESDKKF